MSKVTILIPSRFNNRWILDLNLRTIRKYTKYPYEIIVGDAGMEQEALDFIADQKDVKLVKCPDPRIPKDHLARQAQTPYFLFLHDDVQILKEGWLTKRVNIMESDPQNGVVGPISTNYQRLGPIRRIFDRDPLKRRFFPLVMLVRKAMQDDLNLRWGIIDKSFDTGGVAYFQYRVQNPKRWKFVPKKFTDDVLHWGQMTWVMKKRDPGTTTLNVDALQQERAEKVERIKEIIRTESY